LRLKSKYPIKKVFDSIYTELPFITLARVINYLLTDFLLKETFEKRIRSILPYIENCSGINATTQVKQSFIRNFILMELKNSSNQNDITAIMKSVCNSGKIKSFFTNNQWFGLFSDAIPWESLMKETKEIFELKMFELNRENAKNSSIAPAIK
jgi:hypothetical protein